jgi:hypothetical protein
MGKFDDTIANYRNQLDDALRGDFPFRFRLWRGGTEITSERDERSEQNIGMFRRLIAAYSRQND